MPEEAFFVQESYPFSPVLMLSTSLENLELSGIPFLHVQHLPRNIKIYSNSSPTYPQCARENFYFP
ncbi:MAG: hypothetical protein ACOC5D_01730, partial [Thermoplasmatota archaeon]